MLRRILERLRSGGTWTVDALAHELDVPPALVEAAIEDLAQRGYLAPVAGPSQGHCPAAGCTSGASPGGGCTACSAAGSCVLGGTRGGENRRVWTLVH